jgi:glycosyltransferase involved in cell wall biosynthesis
VSEPIHLFMTTDAVGGVWQYALDLARGLEPHGVRTTLAVLGPAPTPDQWEEAERVPGIRLIRADFPLEWLALSGAVVEAAGCAVAALARESKADIVHLNTPALGAEGGFTAPVVAAAHSCVATWWQAVGEGPMPNDFAWRTALVRRGYANADVLITPSQAFADATQQVYGLTSAPTVVWNGRRRSGLKPEGALGDFAFTAGRLWDPGKGMQILDRAAARMSTLVVAAGPLSGPHGQSVPLQHIRTLGRVQDDEIARRLSQRPVFVSPSLYEPFGLAVLEAAQVGCALVLSDIPTFRELWGGAAVFTPPGDEAALADAVQHLMLQPDVRLELGEAARKRARQYKVSAMAARLHGIYRDLLEDRARVAAA